MRVENELGAVRVGLVVLEQPDELRHERGMRAGFDLVDKQHVAVCQRLDDGAGEAKPDQGAERLFRGFEVDVGAGAARYLAKRGLERPAVPWQQYRAAEREEPRLWVSWS
jgi:hypothetical protein